MTELDTGVIPELSQGRRMDLALNHAGISGVEMADYLGVTDATVSRWMHDKVAVKRGMLRLWALRTGVSFAWLETGMAPQQEPGSQSVRHQGLEPRTRWFAASLTEAVAA